MYQYFICLNLLLIVSYLLVWPHCIAFRLSDGDVPLLDHVIQLMITAGPSNCRVATLEEKDKVFDILFCCNLIYYLMKNLGRGNSIALRCLIWKI